MEQVHRRAIQSNFVSLVETTDLDSMVTALYERGVFSEQMIEPYQDTTVSQRERKRNLYLDIKRRGPDAFSKLLEVLKEHGYWDLVRDLDPNSSLHLRPHRSTNIPAKPTPTPGDFISISHEKHKNKTESEATRIAATAGGPAPNVNNNEQAVPFVVKKSTKFIDDNESKDIKTYRTRGRNRGVLLLFSYVSFERDIEPYRYGVNVDCQNLKHLFSELGFTVRAYTDLTREETVKTLSMLKDVLVECECVFVVVSSHGHERASSSDVDVRCSDGALLSLREIISYFSNKQLPHLAHVPKVFVFQICRGTSMDYVPSETQPPPPPPHLSMPDTDGTPLPADQPASPARRAPLCTKNKSFYSNILIAQSTLPGFVSYRDKELGSWYIQALCEVFAERAHDTHVDDLFTLVDTRLEERFQIQTSSVDRWRFNQRLYLHPGLHE